VIGRCGRDVLCSRRSGRLDVLSCSFYLLKDITLSTLKNDRNEMGQWKIQELASVVASPVDGVPRKKRRRSEELLAA
jgi:hypothetical protein